MRRRAELEQQTRARITESTIALHEQLGPARTSVSAIAEHAGVRRSTVYRHFPTEDSLFAACSSHWRAANPAPDLRRWSAIADPVERLRTALDELYAFYGRTHSMYDSLLRDEPVLPVVGRLLAGFHGYLDEAQRILVARRGLRGHAARSTRAAIGLALAFETWRTLTHGQGLGDREAAALMCRLVEQAATANPHRRVTRRRAPSPA
jgi:AcrR family transcriptional regulator